MCMQIYESPRLKNTYLSIVVAAMVFSLSGCGGGPSAAAFTPSATALTPQITLYGTSFNLSNTVISAMSSLQGLLVGCPTGGSDIQMRNFEINSNGSFSTYYIILSGDFTLPNGGQINCNTTGITGTISRHRLFDGNNNLIFDMTNLNLPANAMQSGWQSYWRAVLAQTGAINSTQASAALITCTNRQNLPFTFQLATVGDISANINSCIN